MSFKKNLKRKIEIDRLTRRVLDSIGSPDNGLHIDKDALIEILQAARYEPRYERDLELFSRDFEAEPAEIIVADNELPLYRTNVADVLLRKSPFLKEMLSIRNARRILNDSDVVVSRRQDTAMKIHGRCMQQLDLRYNKADIESIYEDGINGLDEKDPEAVVESLELFAELLGLRSSTAFSDMPGIFVFCKPEADDTGRHVLTCPLIIFNRRENTLWLLEKAGTKTGRQKPSVIREIIAGNKEPDAEGTEVFDRLKTLMQKHPPSDKPIDSFVP